MLWIKASTKCINKYIKAKKKKKNVDKLVTNNVVFHDLSCWGAYVS